MDHHEDDVNRQDPGVGLRARKAAATRRAIRRAATKLFLEQGYGATTLRQVADGAGIGERTLYDAFGNKAALFRHVVDVATAGDEQPLPVAQRPVFRAALDQRDPVRALALFASASAAVLERAGALIMVAVESSGADPAMRAFADTGAANTRRVAAEFVDHLATIHPIADVELATATVLTAVSPHVHQILRTTADMDADHYQDWLVRVLTAVLLPPTADDSR